MLFSITQNEYAEQDLGVPTNTAEEDARRPRKERLKSLDTFRGYDTCSYQYINVNSYLKY